MADIKRESNNSDRMQVTNTPEKDNKFEKKIVRSVRGEGVRLPPLLVAVLLRLAQGGMKNVRVKRRENAG